MINKVEEKENKIEEELTFAPKLNPTSLKLVPKHMDRVEERLLIQGAKVEEKLKRIRSAQRLPFKPNIYNKNHSRCQSASKKVKKVASPNQNPEIPPLPPKTGPAQVPKLQFKESEHLMQYETKREKERIRDYSPVLDERRDSNIFTSL